MMPEAILVVGHPDSLPCLALSSVMLPLMASSGMPGNSAASFLTSSSCLAAFPVSTGGDTEVEGGVTGTEGGDKLRGTGWPRGGGGWLIWLIRDAGAGDWLLRPSTTSPRQPPGSLCVPESVGLMIEGVYSLT